MLNFFKSQNNTVTKIFIVGCGHSGTSIMLSLLDNHESIQVIPNETGIFFKKKREVKNFFREKTKLAKLENKKALVEKTPKHVEKIDFIINTYPDAKIIVMVRDGRDVACSIKERTGNFEEGVSRWISSNEKAYEFINNDNVEFIKLEDLVANPMDTMKFIFDFININFDNKILSKQGNEVKTFYDRGKITKSEIDTLESHSHERHMKNRNWQINQGLFKTTRRWDKDMSEEELVYFFKHAEEYFFKYGYSK